MTLNQICHFSSQISIDFLFCPKQAMKTQSKGFHGFDKRKSVYQNIQVSGTILHQRRIGSTEHFLFRRKFIKRIELQQTGFPVCDSHMDFIVSHIADKDEIDIVCDIPVGIDKLLFLAGVDHHQSCLFDFNVGLFPDFPLQSFENSLIKIDFLNCQVYISLVFVMNRYIGIQNHHP